MPSTKTCDGCGRKFLDNTQLVRHMKDNVHCSSFLIPCNGCDKLFANSLHFAKHQEQTDHTPCYNDDRRMEHITSLNYESLPTSNKRKSDNPNEVLEILIDQKVPKKKSKIDTELLPAAQVQHFGSMHFKDTNPLYEKHSSNKVMNYTDIYRSSSLGVTNTFACASPTEKDNKSDDGDNHFSLEIQDERFSTPNKNRSSNQYIVKESNNTPDFEDHDSYSSNESSSCGLNVDDIEFISALDDEKDYTNKVHVFETILNMTPDDLKDLKPIEYIIQRCKFIYVQRKSTHFDLKDHHLISLLNMLRQCPSIPLGFFDKIITWHCNVSRDERILASTLSNGSSNNYPSLLDNSESRKTYIKSLYARIFGKRFVESVKPHVVDISFQLKRRNKTHNSIVQATKFDWKEVLCDLLSDPEIMDLDNLQFYDKNDLSKIHPLKSPITSVIDSEVFRMAHKRLCKKDNDVLWPLVIYSDEINFDQRGKLKLDPLTVAFLRTTTERRNHEHAWRIFGMVHGIDNIITKLTLTPEEKTMIYHKVLYELMKDLFAIQSDEDGIPWTFKLPNGQRKKYFLKIYLQFIIGDTKGHDHLCGRMGSYSTGMRQLVRDCDVSPKFACCHKHKCHYRTLKSVFIKFMENKLNDISFHQTFNAFWKCDWGDNTHSVYGGVPAEFLHMLKSGICKHNTEAFLSTLPTEAKKILKAIIVDIVSYAESQTYKEDFHPMNAFRGGMSEVKYLTGDENVGRIQVFYLALMDPLTFKEIANSIAKRGFERPERFAEDGEHVYGKQFLKDWIMYFEETLVFMEWLKTNVHDQKFLYNRKWLIKHKGYTENDFQNIPNFNNSTTDETEFAIDSSDPMEYDVTEHLPYYEETTDCYDDMCFGSPASIYVNQYVKRVKDHLDFRGGNGSNIPKAHLLKHITHNLVRHGPSENYDGSCPESNAKEIVKAPANRTQKQHRSMSIATARRYHENHLIKRASSQCNKLEIFPHKKDDEYNDKIVMTGSRYSITKAFHPTDRSTTRSYAFEWKKKYSRTRYNGFKWLHNDEGLTHFDDSILLLLTFYLWHSPLGGVLHENAKVVGHTEFKKDGILYRCHPSYRSSDEAKYDWVYVQWDGYANPVPAKLLMIVDLEDCKVVPENEAFQNLGVNIPNNHAQCDNNDDEYISSQKAGERFLCENRQLAIVHSAKDYRIPNSSNVLSQYHVKGNITSRIETESKLRVVPISSIIGKAFVFPNTKEKPNDEGHMNLMIHPYTATVLEPREHWSECFINNKYYERL